MRVLLLALYAGFDLLATAAAVAIPVVPNFQQGVLSSTTKTTSKVVEVINSYEYRTGYEYSANGTNIAPVGGAIAPASLTTTTNTLNGVSSRWTGLDPCEQTCLEHCQTRCIVPIC